MRVSAASLPLNPATTAGAILWRLTEPTRKYCSKAEIQVDLDDAALRKRDEERRAAGLPDLCDGCSKPLGMSCNSVRRRRAKAHPWHCSDCGKRLPRVQESIMGRATERAKKHGPDLCGGCAAPLAMGRLAVTARASKPQPWLCLSCAHTDPDSPWGRASAHAQHGQDLCEADGCSNPLGMTISAVRKRLAKPHPWRCGPCGRLPAVNRP